MATSKIKAGKPAAWPDQPRRRYGQLCSLALALDVVGERWTMLLLRELFAGPKRFTDLHQGLPGIGTAVLAERLKQLKHHGLVSHRRLGPPAPAVVYQLTARGLALDPVLSGLAQWGTVYLGGNGKLTTRPRWLLQALAATATAPPRGLERVTNFVLDGEECHLLIAGDRMVARDGLHPEARVSIRGTTRDLYQLATFHAKLPGSLHRLAVEGDRRSAGRLLNHLVVGRQRAAEIRPVSA